MQAAVIYARTSSAAGVGDDRDSLARQTAACEQYARQHRLEIVNRYHDAAVSGTDPIDQRPGFRKMMSYMLGNGARVILVETADRFARDLLVQITGHQLLQERGIELVTVDNPGAFTDDSPTAVMIRQIMGAFAEFQRALMVQRMHAGKVRTGRYGGLPRMPDKVKALARRLAKGRSLRAVAAELERRGHVTGNGKPYSPTAIRRMLS